MSVPAPVSFGPIDDPTQQDVQCNDPCSTCGPYVGTNGAWYWILLSISKANNSTSFSAWKSTDGGATRTQVATIQTNFGEIQSRSDVSYRGSGDIIDMVYQDFDTTLGRGNLFTTTFDMASETFGPLSDTGVVHIGTFGQGASPQEWRVGANANGDQVVVYDRTLATFPVALSTVYAVVKTAGVWGAPITISGAVPAATLDQVIRDKAGNLGILWSDNNVAASQAIGSFLTLRNNFFYSILDGGGGVSTFTAFANAGGTFGPSYSPFAGPDYGYDDNDLRPGIYDPSTDSIVFTMFKGTFSTTPNVDTQEIGIIVGTPSAAPVFTYHTVIPSEATGGPTWSYPVIAGRSDGTEYSVLFARKDNGPLDQLALATASSLSGPWTITLDWYDAQTDPPPDTASGDSPFNIDMFNNWVRYVGSVFVAHTVIEYIVGGQTHDLGMLFVPTIPPPPVVVPTLPGGGRGFIIVRPNFFDSCLGREYLLYKRIDRELLKCGVKPACFCIDERDWGGNFSEHEEVPMGPPEGAIAFNPTGQLPLPTAASGDNVIFTFHFPWGYDGVILGQYQGYYGVVLNPPIPATFVEGSGDIAWRLSVAGRFARDCGNMLVSLGSIRNMAPIAGGLQIRSENIIQYIVAAPNLSGTLAPGLGNIVAGIHGWMWPRK